LGRLFHDTRGNTEQARGRKKIWVQLTMSTVWSGLLTNLWSPRPSHPWMIQAWMGGSSVTHIARAFAGLSHQAGAVKLAGRWGREGGWPQAVLV
jgi:hypothetical protein